VQGKRSKITSVVWFISKQRVEDRVAPANTTCWLQIFDKITTKNFQIQGTLAPGHQDKKKQQEYLVFTPRDNLAQKI